MWRKIDVEIITCVHTKRHVAGIRGKIAMKRYYFIQREKDAEMRDANMRHVQVQVATSVVLKSISENSD
jgi:hypothetical protein